MIRSTVGAWGWWGVLASWAFLAGTAAPIRAVVTAESLLVNLDVNSILEDIGNGGTGSAWANTGSLGGSFNLVGASATVVNAYGPNFNVGVEFNGATGGAGTAYQGPIAPASISGNGTRSIEVWVYNPVVAAEETLVSWGRRGGPNGTNLSFNYGNNGTFGATGHWGSPDLGWGGTFGTTPTPSPAADAWHHLVYTYDGTAARVYSDGVLRNGRNVALNTHGLGFSPAADGNFTITVGAQNVNPAPNLEPNLRLSGGIARLRVHDGVLSAADVRANFNEEAPEFGLSPVPPPPPPPTPELMRRGPKHRYEFSGNADDSVGGAHGNVVDPTGTFASFTTLPGQLDLRAINAVISSNQNPFTQGAYVNLPNGIVSALGQQATFEMWATVETRRNWDRLFDFGRSDLGEDLSGGGANSNYIFATTQNGANGTLRVAHRSPNPTAAGFDENITNGFSGLSTGVEHHLVVVWDEIAGFSTVYLDGAALEVATVPIRPTMTLAGLQDVNNWLGRSQWGDPLFDGSYNEFRLYDYALTANEVLGNFQAGPNVVNVIPEPSTWVLAGLLAAGVAARRRRL